jgi:histidine triad (HIT) family protein
VSCLFCRIVRLDAPAEVVFADDHVVAFLDHRPLFPGHVLVVPRAHAGTLTDLPQPAIGTLFTRVQWLAAAVQDALQAEGSFVAVNNVVSQSVPHLHVHVVPRRKGDGLRGFFWPRQPYESEAHMSEVAAKIRAALAALVAAE